MERRLYERISIPVKLAYEVKNRPKILKESVSKNISGGGICLSLSEKLLPRTELIMKVELGNADRIFMLKGVVVWNRGVEIIEKKEHVVYYDTGIELIEADPININKIISYFYGKSF